MPSDAFTNHLEVLLRDVREFKDAHQELRTGLPGRQWRLGALNRAAVILAVSAWEAYLESLVREGVTLLRPAAPLLGVWPPWSASIGGSLGRFNTPNAENTKRLFLDSFGLQDIITSWRWQRCSPIHSRAILNEALQIRHQIAHGVNPRPTVHNTYAHWLPGFLRRLGRCTDAALQQHFINEFGINPHW